MLQCIDDGAMDYQTQEKRSPVLMGFLVVEVKPARMCPYRLF
jgi:hypothetical protein